MKPDKDMDLEAIHAEIDALPVTNKGTVRTFTRKQDMILRYAKNRGVPWADLVRWWQNRYGWGCASTLQRRWKQINDGGHE